VRIDLTDLLRNVGNKANVEEELRVDLAEDGLLLTGPVKVRLRFSNLGPAVLVFGTAETEMEIDCSRCGQKFRLPLTADISEEYSKNPPSVDKEAKVVEIREEDFVYPIEPDNTLDLTEVIRQNILLALPMQTICGQCKGEKKDASTKKATFEHPAGEKAVFQLPLKGDRDQ
jgi:uncharacterized protein